VKHKAYVVDWETPKQNGPKPEIFSRLSQQLNRQDLIAVQDETISVLDALGLRHILSETAG